MKREGIDALVVIGGDGSLTGARLLAQEFDVPVSDCPVPSTTTCMGTDTTIGYDTALNTILDAVDKIRDTATSRTFVLCGGNGTRRRLPGIERAIAGCQLPSFRNSIRSGPVGRVHQERFPQIKERLYRVLVAEN